MALQFDMSKNNWQQDLVLQEQISKLGKNLGDAGAVAGGALGKVLGKTFLPEGGKNLPNWFKKTEGGFDEEAYEEDSQKYKEEKAKLTGQINWGEYPGMYDNPQDRLKVLREKGLRDAPRKSNFTKEAFKLTPGKGLENLGKTLFPNKGKNVGRNVAAATGVGAGLYFNPLSTVLGLGGLFGADKYKDEIKSAAGKIKSSAGKFKDRVKEDMSTEYFEGPQDSTLMKAIKSQLKRRKINKTPYVDELLEYEPPTFMPVTPDSVLENELQKNEQRNAGTTKFSEIGQKLYSPKGALDDAILRQNFGPLQSVMNQSAQVNPIVVPQEAPMSNEMLRELMERNKIRPNSGLNVRRNNPY